MQGLAERGLLSKFHYLSTVSGGGYARAWLTSWVKRAVDRDRLKTFKAIEAELKPSGKAPEPLKELRKNRAFLTPKVGITSTDTWAAIAVLIRNLLLNWIVFVPLLACVLLIPRLAQSFLLLWTYSTDKPESIFVTGWDWLLNRPESHNVSWNPHTWLDGLGAFLVLVGIVISMVNRSMPPENALDDSGFRKWVLIPVLLGAFCLVAASCSWLAIRNEAVLNHQMLPQWMGGCAGAFVAIRALSYIWLRLAGKKWDPEQRIYRIALELIAYAVSGAVVGLVIWSGLRLRSSIKNWDMTYLGDAAVYGVPWFLMAFLAGQVVLAGLTSHLFPQSGDRTREWLARASGLYLFVAVAWLVSFGLVIYGAQELQEVSLAKAHILPFLTALSGVISLLGGASPISGVLGDRLKPGQLSAGTVIAVASAVFILCLSVWVAAVTTILLREVSVWLPQTLFPWLGTYFPWLGTLQKVSLDQQLVARTDPNSLILAKQRFFWTLAAMAVLFLISRGASSFVNVNYFSLNAMYRNRLVRAFLGASNIKYVTDHDPGRNPFDKFAEGDNIAMHELHPNKAGPFPVVNIALNLTATDNNALQERKADSFISTPLHSGGDLVGYRASEKYAKGITLGTAVSLSGAALSPNWGYHSSAITSFIMTLFNVRLGAWLGNPKKADWESDGPRSGFHLFFQEALGRPTADKSFIYLSDGGHFDNLGLYEMVRRRCHTIVVSDAGADSDCTLEDLGRAVRRIYIDLGVRIEFERIDVRKRGPDPANPGVYCAVGRLIYPDQIPSRGDKPKDGRIVYVKPGLYDDVPADVRAYAAANAKFPHDTTLNQWFTESQFESYRALGAHTIAMIAGERDPSGNLLQPQPAQPIEDLFDFCLRADEYLKGYRERVKPQAQLRAVS
jgi:hypothetical protein